MHGHHWLYARCGVAGNSAVFSKAVGNLAPTPTSLTTLFCCGPHLYWAVHKSMTRQLWSCSFCLNQSHRLVQLTQTTRASSRRSKELCPNRMRRVRRLQVESKHGRNITPEYLADMQVADATIKEVLRLAVIINTVPKRALTTFELCGYTIPQVITAHCTRSRDHDCCCSFIHMH